MTDQKENKEQQQSESVPTITYKEHPSPLDELKHSINLHWTVLGGPTPQLAAFMVKVLDFLEDPDKHQRDMSVLSYSIAEAVALYVQRSVDDRAARAENQGITFPQQVKKQGDNILILMGRVRSQEDKAEAKLVLLRGVADALRSLATFTKAVYPAIIDARGQKL